MNEIETDNYRTQDGKGYFTFSFFKEDEFIDIDVTFCPTLINLQEKKSFCTASKRGGFTILSTQKARDSFSARLIAGEWAETLWKEFNSSLENV